MAVVPYGTSEVTLTPRVHQCLRAGEFREGPTLPRRGAPGLHRGGTGAHLREFPSIPAAATRCAWGPRRKAARSWSSGKRYTEVLVRVYRRHPYYPHTKLEYTYTVLVVQGGPIPVDLSVEGLTGNVLPNGGTATLKATDTRAPADGQHHSADGGVRPRPKRATFFSGRTLATPTRTTAWTGRSTSS